MAPRKNPLPEGSSAPKKEKKGLISEFKELTALTDKETDGLKAKEALFARLIAEMGFTQAQAYVEAFAPAEGTQERSIIEAASRKARKPAVQAEIARILSDISDIEMSRNSKLIMALDGRKTAERLSLILYSIATSPTIETKYVLKSIELLGKARHVDMWANSTSTNITSNVLSGALAVDQNASVSEAKQNLLNAMQKMIASKTDHGSNLLADGAIDIVPEAID